MAYPCLCLTEKFLLWGGSCYDVRMLVSHPRSYVCDEVVSMPSQRLSLNQVRHSTFNPRTELWRQNRLLDSPDIH